MSDRQSRNVLRYLHRLVGAPADADASDRELLEQFARARSEEAFETLVARHGPLVRGVCRRVLGNPTDADDAFQATFLVLARKAGSVRWQNSVAPWLHAVARRISMKTRTGIQRRRVHEYHASKEPGREPADDLSWRELQGVIDEELDRLPDHYRAPLILCYLEGKTRDEAAQELGWSEGSVKGRLERGRDMLRDRLSQRGLTLSAALLGMLVASPASAAVPAALQATTVESAGLFAAGKGVEGLVSSNALSAAGSVLDGMAFARFKLVAGVLILVVGAGVGAGYLVHATMTSERTGEEQVAVEMKTEPPAALEKREPPREGERRRDGDRPPREGERPREGDRPPRETDQPRRERDRPRERDGAARQGVLQAVDPREGEIRIGVRGDGDRLVERSYPLARDARVLVNDVRSDGVEAPLASLRDVIGGPVRLQFGDDNKTVVRIHVQARLERGVVRAVEARERIIVLGGAGKESRRLPVAEDARIQIGRRPGRLEQVEPGQRVSVHIVGKKIVALEVAPPREGERDTPRER